jgi:Zn ribbon nucleic-acid-binding protein
MDKCKLQECIENGDSLIQISKKLNTSQTNVRYWLKKFELKLKRGAKGKKPKDFVFPRKCSCGETDPNKFYGNKTTVCAKCHSRYTLAKGQENRIYIVEKLGSKCFNCGFDKWKSSLDVHHLDPSEKDPSFSTIRYWSKENIDHELIKCVLLCRNCHAALHNGELINESLFIK